MKSAYETIIYLMLTEKSTLLKEKNQYAFKVARKATKLEIAAAIEKIYGVKVKAVTCAVTPDSLAIKDPISVDL